MSVPQMARIEMPPVTVRIVHAPPSFKPLPFPTFGSGRYRVVWVNGLIDLYGSEENLRIAVWADHIEVARLRWEFNGRDIIYTEEPGRTLAPDDEAVVRGVLTSDGTYNWDEESDCTPAYEIRMKFWRRDQVVFVDLCMGCTMMRVVRGDREFDYRNFEFGAQALAETLEIYFPGLLEKLPTRALQPTQPAIHSRVVDHP